MIIQQVRKLIKLSRSEMVTTQRKPMTPFLPISRPYVRIPVVGERNPHGPRSATIIFDDRRHSNV